MQLISWNVAGRKAKLPAQAAALRQLQPDLIALQEVTVATLPRWQTALQKNGYPYLIHNQLPNPSLHTGPRRYSLLIAARWPLQKVTDEPALLPWPERMLTGELEVGHRPVRVTNVHIPPGSSNGWTKIETFEGIYETLRQTYASAHILCGDFNSPQEEGADGLIITWGQKRRPDGTWRYTRTRGNGDRWDQGERLLLEGMGAFGFRDVFRTLNGYGEEAFSWYVRHKDKRIGRRFDHIFATRQINAVSCSYIHQWREAQLSDHSAIEMEWDL